MGIITVMDRAFEQVMYAMLSISICISSFFEIYRRSSPYTHNGSRKTHSPRIMKFYCDINSDENCLVKTSPTFSKLHGELVVWKKFNYMLRN